MATVEARELGARVGEARRRAGLTQGELAAQIGLDRSGLVKVETGVRRLTALELARIANVLGERVEWFVTSVPTAIVAHRNTRDPGEPDPRVDTVAEIRARAVEFVTQQDQRFGALLNEVAPFAVPTDNDQAEGLAADARSLLTVEPDEPLLNLGVHAIRLGTVPFTADLGPDAPDAASILLAKGAVALVNGSLRVGRRRLSLAHELGHVLVKDQYTVDWRTDGSNTIGQREALLDRFARALLLPPAAFLASWKRLGGTGDEWRSAAVRSASHFQVDMSTLARRLLDLDAIDDTQAGQIRRVRTTKADIVEHNLVVRDELTQDDLPRDYVAAVLRLYRSEVISEARTLDLLFGSWESGDLPQLPSLPEEAIWQFVS